MIYNISITRPAGFIHSSGFNEVADSLAWALASLGHQAGITHNWLSTEDGVTNIVFGAELLAPQTLPRNTIIFNLEQPTHPHMPKVRELAKGLQVWDYCLTNVARWQQDGYDVRHLPIGWTPNLARIPYRVDEDKDIDVLFYGFMTPRRQAIVEELYSLGLNVVVLGSCYGGGRDYLISRAKVVLNIHHDGRDRFEIVRVSYLLANHKCVVSEISSDDSEYADLDRALIRVPYEQIVNKCVELVRPRQMASDSHYLDMQRIGFDLFSKRDFIASVKLALETPSETPIERRYREGTQHGDMAAFLPWLRENAKGTILEIGVRDGASTSAFLLGLEKAGGVLLSLDINDCSAVAKGHPQWKFVQANSQDPKLHIPPLDIVLIDGDHSREGYRADLERYYQLVKPGGLIISHDIDPEPGQTVEDVPGSDYPSRAIKEEYFNFAKKHDLLHKELPGKYGLGVMVKASS